nr:hypothetical protein [Tanacetum cinerariifolium]
MRTRRSMRTSPLAYDPEVERSARLRRKAVRQFSTNLDFAGLKELFTEMSDDDATGAESPPRGVDSYYRPGNFEDPSPIVYPAAVNGAVSNFKIQPNLIAILPVFRGHEEPYAHLREFYSIADTYQVNNTTKDGVRLRLFPFSVKDQAKARFTSLEPGSIHSWSEMQSAFLDEFYSISKTAFVRNRIKAFRQITVFYDGLDYHNQQFVMATSGGMFFSRPMEEEWEFFEKLSKGSKTQASVDRNNNHTSANFLSNQHGTNSKISELSKKVALLLRNLGKGVPNVSQVWHNACSMCGDPSHSANNCQSWGAPSNEEQYQDHGQGSSNGQQSNVDQKFDLILSELAKSNQGANLKFESLSKSVAYLERQMGQLAEEVHTRETGKLPSYSNFNPKHKPGGPEHVNMVTSLRTGKTYNNDIKIPNVHDFSHDVEDFVTDDEIVVEGRNADNVKSDSELVKDVPKPPTQNPEATESPKTSIRLAKKGPHSKDMWETFKQVKINLPLIDAIKQIPAYAKFLKDLCTQKRKLKATLPKKIDLTEHVSAVLSSSLPPKFKDPGAPLISLLDLGASINIIPASLVDKDDLGTLRKTDTIISLADRSTKIPRGILEDAIVKVEDFYYPVDFFVMDTEINCRTGTMDIAFGNMKLRLNVFNSLNSPISNDCYHIDTIDECIQTHTPRREFQLIEEEFLLSLEETPLQSQQVQQSTLNEVQEYVDCLLVHQDVLQRARGYSKDSED